MAATLITAGWLALLLAIAWGIVRALRVSLDDDEPPRLRRDGVPIDRLARAVRRCVLCPGKAACRRGERIDCPNRALFDNPPLRGERA